MTVSVAEVDVERLRAWLVASVPALAVTDATPLTVGKLAGGYSNLTFAVTIGSGADATRVILRRGPVGVRAARGAHDMHREYRVLTAVSGTDVPVPTPIALCDDDAVIGGVFFLMSAVEGVVVRSLRDAPALRDPAVMRRMSEACIDGLAALHALPVMESPLFDAARVAGYGARQVEGFTGRWAAARTPDVPDDDAEVVFAWLAEHLPAPMAPALLHNDWKFDNLVVDAADPTRIRGVLDWEMSSVGDPRFDLATSLGYWIEATDAPMLQAAAMGVTTAPGCLTRAEVVARYATRRGIVIEHPVYWWVFGLAKLAVIVVQLYARFARGQVTDQRYASLGAMAAVLMQTARAAIAGNTLSP